MLKINPKDTSEYQKKQAEIDARAEVNQRSKQGKGNERLGRKAGSAEVKINQIFEMVVTELRQDRSFVDFVMPAARVATGYLAIINEPMDLLTMLDKAKKCKYRLLEAFHRDLELILANCIQYNSARGLNLELEPLARRLVERGKAMLDAKSEQLASLQAALIDEDAGRSAPDAPRERSRLSDKSRPRKASRTSKQSNPSTPAQYRSASSALQSTPTVERRQSSASSAVSTSQYTDEDSSVFDDDASSVASYQPSESAADDVSATEDSACVSLSSSALGTSRPISQGAGRCGGAASSCSMMSAGSAGSGGSGGGMSEAGSETGSDIFGPSGMPGSPSAASTFSADDESAMSDASSGDGGDVGLRSPGASEYESDFGGDFGMDDVGGPGEEDEDDMLQELEEGMET